MHTPNTLVIESIQRERVISIAKSFIGTPYRHAGRVKGSGVDCLTLLAEVYIEAGLIDKCEIPYYDSAWHLHKTQEKYLNGLLEYTHEIEGPPKPGDIVLWKFGHCYSHGAIVVEWPIIIHAHINTKCTFEDAEKSAWLTHIGEKCNDTGKPRLKKFFSYWS